MDLPKVAENGRHVLLIDDEQMVLSVTSRVVQMFGHTVRTASSPGEAVSAFAAGRFDVVICDHHLGSIDVADMCATFKNASPSTLIYLSSGLPMAFDPAIFSGFLQKPYTAAQLHEVVQRAGAPREEDFKARSSGH